MCRVKIDYTLSIKDITKELISKNINVNGCLDQNFYKKLSFKFTSKEAYDIFNDIRFSKCLMCDNEAKFMSFTKGYRKTCSVKCAAINPARNKRIKETSLIKDKDGLNGYDRGIIKMIKTKERLFPRYNRPKHCGISRDKNLYKRQVLIHTRKQPLHILENIDLRGHYGKNKNAYHLDHMYSIHYGFINCIPPWIIGSIHNLRMIPAHENLGSKNKLCSITIDELLNKFYNLA